MAAPAQVAGPTPFVPLGAVGQSTRPGPTNRPVDMVTMQYPNSDVLDVLHLYENLTGKKLVMDNNVQGKVNIFIAKPIPREEAINIIEMNLALNGFSLVPAEGDVIEVVGVNKNPRAAAVPIISDPADLPPVQWSSVTFSISITPIRRSSNKCSRNIWPASVARRRSLRCRNRRACSSRRARTSCASW